MDATVRARLKKYVELLGKWRNITNLISDNGFGQIWGRHILDGVHLQIQQPEARIWLDIGSGAGLPGAVIASIIADLAGSRVLCVEVDRRKCAFLREVASQIDLPLKVHNTAAERMLSSEGLKVDVVTARAFSTLDRILQLAEPQLKQGAVAILPRGHNAHEEVARLDRDLYSVSMTSNHSPGAGFFVRVELRGSRTS